MAQSISPARARTRMGLVEGSTLPDGMQVFLGIPFAAPPVGALRWKPPQPPSPWSGVRNAKALAAPPYQRSALDFLIGKLGPQSEDCLYLNVWRPATEPGTRLPVMVWIHGGGFVGGATSQPLFTATRLARKGVVVVSIAYRVGAMGFFAHPELTREGRGASGNYGLLDQIAGLRWVRNNIERFGGDPRNVTVFGESAGGISVSMLAASPLAKGLFDKAISQSGGSFAPVKRTLNGGQAPRSASQAESEGDRIGRAAGQMVRSLALVENEGQRLARSVGAMTVEDLRALPIEQILAWNGDWWPVCDERVLVGDPIPLYRARRFNDTPVLMGWNSDEGALFVPADVTPEAFEENIRTGYGDFAEEVLSAYPHANAADAFKAQKGVLRDSMFAWPTWTWAKLQTRFGKGAAYVYYLDHRTAQWPEGSTHGIDLGYVFGNRQRGNAEPVDLDDADISRMMQDYWVNFARHGNPNGPELPVWPRYTAAQPVLLKIQNNPEPGPIPGLQQLQVLDRYFDWRGVVRRKVE